MNLTKQQIEDMRTSLGKGAQPFTKEAIDALCRLAFRGCDRAEERRSGWIPVSERLPEPEIDVLVRGTNGFISIDSVESFEGFDVAVTHWMPLPDGPHGGGKDG